MNIFTQPKQTLAFRKQIGICVGVLVSLFAVSMAIGHFTGRFTASEAAASVALTTSSTPAPKPADPFDVYVNAHPNEFTRVGCMRTYIKTRGYTYMSFAKPHAVPHDSTTLTPYDALLDPRYGIKCGEVMTGKDKWAARWIAINAVWDDLIIGWFSNL